jgi:hypothetical protein
MTDTALGSPNIEITCTYFLVTARILQKTNRTDNIKLYFSWYCYASKCFINETLRDMFLNDKQTSFTHVNYAH